MQHQPGFNLLLLFQVKVNVLPVLNMVAVQRLLKDSHTEHRTKNAPTRNHRKQQSMQQATMAMQWQP